MKAYVITLSLGFVTSQSYTVIAPGPSQAILGATKWAEESGSKNVQFISCVKGPELITVREKPKARRAVKEKAGKPARKVRTKKTPPVES